jgi:uncharacterized protein YdiU (UPF0061 family)
MRTLALALKVFCKKQALTVRVVNNSANHYKSSFREELLSEARGLLGLQALCPGQMGRGNAGS